MTEIEQCRQQHSPKLAITHPSTRIRHTEQTKKRTCANKKITKGAPSTKTYTEALDKLYQIKKYRKNGKLQAKTNAKKTDKHRTLSTEKFLVDGKMLLQATVTV